MQATGWDGFEYAGEWLEGFFGREGELKSLLAEYDLELATFYCPCSCRDQEAIRAELEAARRKADFLAAMGSEILLIDGGSKPAGREANDDDYRRVAEVANRLGEIARERGLQASWHQHWGTIFESAAPFARLMEWTDPDLVAFTPDTAQLALGDFNVVETFRRYLDRIRYVHFKDLDADRRFIELGAGTIDFPAVWEVLREAGYEGWIMVDLDYTRLPPLESSRVNKRYLSEVLGMVGERGNKGELGGTTGLHGRTRTV